MSGTSTVESSRLHKEVRVAFWNAWSVKNKKVELQRFACEYDVIVLVETWLRDQDEFFFDCRGFNEYKNNQQTGDDGGVAFLIRESLQFVAIDGLTNESSSAEVMGVEILNVSDPFTIIACYRPPGRINKLTQ